MLKDIIYAYYFISDPAKYNILITTKIKIWKPTYMDENGILLHYEWNIPVDIHVSNNKQDLVF